MKWKGLRKGMRLKTNMPTNSRTPPTLPGTPRIPPPSRVLDETEKLFEAARGNPANLTPFTPPPPSTHTSEAPGGLLITMDWVCLLSRTFRQVFNTVTGTMRLDLYEGSHVDLDRDQTRALLQWMKDSSQSNNPYMSIGRQPKMLLDHPAVAALLAEVPNKI
jgi:hypothetical protein